MTKKYTPGPWVVFDSDAEHPGIDNANGDTSIILFGINDSCGVRGNTMEEIKANALLISCAPELLEALEEIVEHYEFIAAFGVDAHTKFNSLIRKAKGE